MSRPASMLLVAVVIACVAALAMWLETPWRAPKLLSEVQVARAWLECTDCRGPYLRRLHDARGRSRDSVLRLLQSALLRGPDEARLSRHRSELLKTWLADSLYRIRKGRPPTPITLTLFLDTYRDGLDAMWRSRAAIALGVLRDPVAIAALDTALSRPSKTRVDSAVLLAAQRARDDSARSALTRIH